MADLAAAAAAATAAAAESQKTTTAGTRATEAATAEATELRVEGMKLRGEVKELRTAAAAATAAAMAMTEVTQLWARQWAELGTTKLELAELKGAERERKGERAVRRYSGP